jgi:nucleoside-diphosphate-sugar epimerase
MNNFNSTIKKSALLPSFLIVGGSRYLSTKITKKLLENKAKVILLDNFTNQSHPEIKELQNHQNVVLINADIVN